MKRKIKNLMAVLVILLLGVTKLFAATIDPYKGYKDLTWGTTVKQAKSKGFKLSLLEPDQAAGLKAGFTKDVDFYFVKSTEKNVQNLMFAYSNDRLFLVIEVLDSSSRDLKKLQARYGSDLQAYGDGYMNQTNGKSSVSIKFADGNPYVYIFDSDVYMTISKQASAKSANASSSDFVSQFDGLAQKLLQDPKKGNKASYAFLDFSTDNKNILVEKYITDALTEAVFNTGKVKIIERDNIEKIINEQKFQASGLVDESQAASIGNIAGVEYVCYGTIKEIDNGYTVNARVVDVESAEICAMSRTNVTKDSYLSNVGKPGSSVKSSRPAAVKKPASSLWTCISSRNEFDGYTTYTFMLKGPQNEFLFLGYDKNDVPSKSIVRAGVNWSRYSSDNYGNYDFKTENNGTISKKFSNATWSKDTGWKDGNDRFGFCYNKGESARFFIKLFEENKYLTVRHDGNVRRFQTEGFWDTVEAYGISKQEISDAIGNEEF